MSTQDGGGITTEYALYGEVSDSIQVQGFAIRDESIINPSYTGVLNYRVPSGSRVSKGGVIADVFQSESDAAAQNMADRIDRQIKSISALAKPVDYYMSTATATGDQIYDSLCGILSDVQKNNFSGVSKQKENLMVALSRKQVISGAESADDYAQRIQELEQEKAGLSSDRSMNTIEAPSAGYFIGATDGFENVMDVKDVTKVTVDEVQGLLETETGTGAQSSVGKICADFKWYLLCIMEDENMAKFEGVEEVTLDIPYASTETIPAKIAAKNRDPDTGRTALVLECTYMDADIAIVRNEMVQINVKTYSGVLVNQRALRFEDREYTVIDEDGNEAKRVRENVKGVYVQYGGQLEFVQVFTEKDVNGYAVCKIDLSEEEQENMVTDHTIQMYDKVVIGGMDLYDGKLVR